MKKSIFSKWHVWLTIIIFLALAIFFTVITFKDGSKEGKKNSIEMER